MTEDSSPLPTLAYAPSRMVPGRTVVFTFRVSTPEFDQKTFEIRQFEPFSRGTNFCDPPSPVIERPNVRPYNQNWSLTVTKVTFGGVTETILARSGQFASDVQTVTAENLVPDDAATLSFSLETHNGVIEIDDVPVFRK